MLEIKGIITALITPFAEDGSVDYVKLNNLINDQIASGIKAVIIGGTTGEGMLIDNIEEFYKNVIKIINNRLIIGVNLNAIKQLELFEKIKMINSLQVQFVLVNTPSYLITSKNGIVEYFNFISEHLTKPYLIYYNPVRSGQYIINSTWEKLLKLNNVIGVKDASNDSLTSNFLIKNKNDLLYFSGNDTTYFNQRILGSDGVISSISNLIPEILIEIDYLITTNNYKSAKELYLKYYELIKTINIEPNPIGLKYLMNEKRINVGNPKFPLTKLSFSNQMRLKLIYERII